MKLLSSWSFTAPFGRACRSVGIGDTGVPGRGNVILPGKQPSAAQKTRALLSVAGAERAQRDGPKGRSVRGGGAVRTRTNPRRQRLVRRLTATFYAACRRGSFGSRIIIRMFHPTSTACGAMQRASRNRDRAGSDSDRSIGTTGTLGRGPWHHDHAECGVSRWAQRSASCPCFRTAAGRSGAIVPPNPSPPIGAESFRRAR